MRIGTMTTDATILEKLLSLPPEELRQVRGFLESLHKKSEGQRKKKRFKGLCADLGLHISDKDIAEARREMWACFPRDDV